MPDFEYAIIIDFEATCRENGLPDPQEIIEFPSVLLRLSDYENVSEFSSFVRPVKQPLLSAFCTNLTSITQEQVDGADPFLEVLARHEKWLASNGLTTENAMIVTCGNWDFEIMFPNQCRVSGIPEFSSLYNQWVNVKKVYRAVTGEKNSTMPIMLDHLDLDLIGHHHRGIDDCRNITCILSELLRRAPEPYRFGQVHQRRE